MLVGVELRRQTVLLNEFVVVRHLGIAYNGLVAVVFFSDDPDVGGAWNALCVDVTGKDEEDERSNTTRMRPHRGPSMRFDLSSAKTGKEGLKRKGTSFVGVITKVLVEGFR